MGKGWSTVLALLLANTCMAQAPDPGIEVKKAQVIQQVCRGGEIKSGPEFEVFQRAVKKLATVVNQDQQHEIYPALVNNSEINAWAVNFDMRNSLLCIPVAMVQFMGDAEGELGFIIAHEVGHAVDDACKTQTGRVAVANSRNSLGAFLGGLLGGEQGAASASAISQQRGCEARADAIGFQISTAAGYSPYAAAGAFGRLEMYTGDTSTGVLARLVDLGRDHPMTPDRIKHMRMILMSYAQNKPVSLR